MKLRIPALVLSCILCGLFFVPIAAAAPQAEQREVWTLKQYPNFKIGFLANNFYKPLPMNKENLKKIFDWAAGNKFAWVEIRDANADLSYEDCKELAAYAASKQVEIVYAMGLGFLDPKFKEAWKKGVANAALFTGPKVIRNSAPGPEFTADPNKAYWTKEEFDQMLPIINEAADAAKKAGLTMVLEHAFEAMAGDGTTSFGMTEIQTMGNANVGSQFDSANFFAVSRAPVNADAAKAYFEKFASKTGYTHLKTSNPADHKVTAFLGDNELDFKVYFDICAKANVNYHAIEIPQQEKFEDVAANLIKSMVYLLRRFNQ